MAPKKTAARPEYPYRGGKRAHAGAATGQIVKREGRVTPVDPVAVAPERKRALRGNRRFAL
jgi:hypothetical protein